MHWISEWMQKDGANKSGLLKQKKEAIDEMIFRGMPKYKIGDTVSYVQDNYTVKAVDYLTYRNSFVYDLEKNGIIDLNIIENNIDPPSVSDNKTQKTPTEIYLHFITEVEREFYAEELSEKTQRSIALDVAVKASELIEGEKYVVNSNLGGIFRMKYQGRSDSGSYLFRIVDNAYDWNGKTVRFKTLNGVFRLIDHYLATKTPAKYEIYRGDEPVQPGKEINQNGVVHSDVAWAYFEQKLKSIDKDITDSDFANIKKSYEVTMSERGSTVRAIDNLIDILSAHKIYQYPYEYFDDMRKFAVNEPTSLSFDTTELIEGLKSSVKYLDGEDKKNTLELIEGLEISLKYA
jgi:hypothetical protein